MQTEWFSIVLVIALLIAPGCRPSDSEKKVAENNVVSGTTDATIPDGESSSPKESAPVLVRHSGYLKTFSSVDGLTLDGQSRLCSESRGSVSSGESLVVRHRIRLVAHDGEFDVYEVFFDFGDRQFTKTVRFKDQTETVYEDASHSVKIVPEKE